MTVFNFYRTIHSWWKFVICHLRPVILLLVGNSLRDIEKHSADDHDIRTIEKIIIICCYCCTRGGQRRRSGVQLTVKECIWVPITRRIRVLLTTELTFPVLYWTKTFARFYFGTQTTVVNGFKISQYFIVKTRNSNIFWDPNIAYMYKLYVKYSNWK